MKKNCMLFVFICATFFGCKKTETKKIDCFASQTTYRQINFKPATIKKRIDGTFFIIEQGAIDTRLNPCNLTVDFQIDNLLVNISGDVKTTITVGPNPCCLENFVITTISR